MNPTTAEVRAFCGAGRSAFFLHHVRSDDGDRFFPFILGLGFWHHSDTEALKTLFDPSVRAHSPYRLRDDQVATPSGLELLNLIDSLSTKRSARSHDRYGFTNRIIRIYRQGDDDSIEFDRVDWEPPRKRVNWTQTRLSALQKGLEEVIGDRKVVTVVVKDLLKGAVNGALVKWLADGPCKGARWYVSSKKWKPDWLDQLTKVDLRLFLVPQIAAGEAVRKEDGLRAWITSAGRPSREGLKLIDSLLEDVKGLHSDPAVVVLPKGFRVLGKASSTEPAKRYLSIVQYQEQRRDVVVPMGGDSIVFPALTACIEYSHRNRRDCDIEASLAHALECTDDWVTAEAGRVLDPIHWQASPKSWRPEPKLLKISTCVSETRFGDLRSADWKSESDAWRQALEVDLGVVTDEKGDRELQLWRSMTEVEGYVCCEPEKRKELRRLVKGIRAFCADPRSHAACMFIAAPGVGKTFLVRRLAKLANLRYVPFNITQMNFRGDILSCFDEIRSKQEESPLQQLLVFVDEVNADLDGSSVYGSFLAPLEEALYVRGGQTFHIKPCLWIFAGTESPEPPLKNRGKPANEERSKKGSDFLSRLTLGVLNLNPRDIGTVKTPDETIKMRRLEKVYLGAVQLLAEYPDVQHVSSPVLEAFNGLPLDTRVRDIKQFVRACSDIQYGRVKSFNLPTKWPRDDDGAHFRRWNDDVLAKREAARREELLELEPADIRLVDTILERSRHS